MERPKKHLVSIDPGLRVMGISIFDVPSAQLLSAKAVRIGTAGRGGAAWLQMAQLSREFVQSVISDRPCTVAVESMRTYVAGKSRPSDLLELQAVAGCVAGALNPTELVSVEPAKWKGQIPREIFSERVAAYIARRGWSDRIEPTKLKDAYNDIYHAIGIGLYILDGARRPVQFADAASTPTPIAQIRPIGAAEGSTLARLRSSAATPYRPRQRDENDV